MKKIKIVSFLMCLMVGLMSCHQDEDTTTVYDRTVLVYIAGDNTLSSFVSDDLSEMLEGMREVDDRHNSLLVYIDDGSVAKLIRLEKDKKNNVIQKTVASYGDWNSVNVANMTEVMNTAFSKYPARSYGLVLWSHGEGWIPKSSNTRWWGQDGGNYIDIPELCGVLQTLPHLDFLLFDACFMQSVEVAYELRKYTDYLVGSPTEIPAPGAPYQEIVPAMFVGSSSAINVAKAYFDYYSNGDLYKGYLPNRWKKGDPWTAGVSISVINTSMLEQLADETKQILPKYIKDRQTIKISDIFNYDCRSSKYYSDFDGLMRYLDCEPAEYASWKAAYDLAIVYWGTTDSNYSSYGGSFSMREATGFSTYIPRVLYDSSNNNYFRQSIKWYSAAGWNETGW